MKNELMNRFKKICFSYGAQPIIIPGVGVSIPVELEDEFTPEELKIIERSLLEKMTYEEQVTQELERVKKWLKENEYDIDKYEYCMPVFFTDAAKQEKIGYIAIRDLQGGGIYYGTCPSFDIEAEDALHKHIPISDVRRAYLDDLPESLHLPILKAVVARIQSGRGFLD